eukprot:1161372-Pelagomonas_calceolata.AAC.2
MQQRTGSLELLPGGARDFWGWGCWARGSASGEREKESLGVQKHSEQPSRSPLALVLLGTCLLGVTWRRAQEGESGCPGAWLETL